MSYRTAYTDKEPSHEPEILAALIWLARQRLTAREKILVCGPYRATFENSALLTKHRYRGLQFMGQQAMERGYKREGGLALAIWAHGGDVERPRRSLWHSGAGGHPRKGQRDHRTTIPFEVANG
ncbi:MAG: hypothetical protein ACYDC5_13850 [Candidatus Dormibacteria bacterium]